MRKLYFGLHGFTLIEQLVVISITTILISILLPTLAVAKEQANRMHCATNLAGITRAAITYGYENNNILPTTNYDQVNVYTFQWKSIGDEYMHTSGVIKLETIDEALAALHHWHASPTAICFWRMALMNYTKPKFYLCKSDRNTYTISPFINTEKGEHTLTGSYYPDFYDNSALSYSMAYPWVGTNVAPWWRVNPRIMAPIMSDMAPFYQQGIKDPAATPGMVGFPKIANSANHNDRGQNVVFSDGHVEWCPTPYVASTYTDNIFTLGSPAKYSSQKALDNKNVGFLPYGPSADEPYDVIMVYNRNYSNTFDN